MTRRRHFLPAKVHVLLSAYNGTEFFAEQMQSILGQSYPAAAITVRDDGSADDTYQIACRFSEMAPRIGVIQGKNLGAAASFFNLLANAEADCDYFAFSDQDDVWMTHKLEDAVSHLGQTDPSRPALYCSRQEYVDRQLQHLGFSRVPRRVGFGNALVENIATGCTVVLNRAAKKLISEHVPAAVIMHDWWCYLVGAAFGQVIYDSRVSVKYRLHGRNAVGAPTHALEKWSRGLTRFIQPRKTTLVDQGREFEHCYGHLLDRQQSKTLERFVAGRTSFWSRIAYAGQKDIWRQSRVDDAILRALIIAGRV